jgi:hypothetical protein
MKRVDGLYNKIKRPVKRAAVIFLLTVGFVPYIWSQKICIKNNVLYDAALIPNLSLELTASDKMSVDIDAAYNPFQISDTKKWKMIMFQPELRFWTFKKYAGSFWGIYMGYKYFNIGGIDWNIPSFGNLSTSRVQGSAYDAGISFGRQWILSTRWGFETFLGLGYSKLVYDKYVCGKCGEKLGNYNDNYFGPSKAGVALIYMLK